MAAFVKSKIKAARDFIKAGDFSAAHAACQEVLSYESNNYTAYVRHFVVYIGPSL